jgi:hypothetical protein
MFSVVVVLHSIVMDCPVRRSVGCPMYHSEEASSVVLRIYHCVLLRRVFLYRVVVVLC